MRHQRVWSWPADDVTKPAVTLCSCGWVSKAVWELAGPGWRGGCYAGAAGDVIMGEHHEKHHERQSASVSHVCVSLAACWLLLCC